MITEINPTYDEALIIDFANDKKVYYLLYARRMDLEDREDILEDDCLIAASDESKEEISNHRDKLIRSGYYKPLELYIVPMPNFKYKKPKDKLLVQIAQRMM